MKIVHSLSTMASETDCSSIRLIRHIMYVGKKEITRRVPLSKYGSVMMTHVTLKYSTMVIILVKQESPSSTQRKLTRN